MIKEFDIQTGSSGASSIRCAEIGRRSCGVVVAGDD